VTEVTDKVERAIARFERVSRQLDQRGGPAQDAARRERQRLNSGFGRTAAKIAAVVAMIWVVAMVIGLLKPIGMFGFLAALFVTVAAVGLMIERSVKQSVSPPAPSADLPNGPMVDRFDSYLYRVRPALPAGAGNCWPARSSDNRSLQQARRWQAAGPQATAR
jgi:hypothetical protein